MSLHVVRTGITRTVILVGRYAVKVPSLRGGSSGDRLASFCDGILANKAERTWHDYEPWRGRVAPVLRSWAGGIIQVYPRCDPLPAGRWEEASDVPWLDPDPGDHKAENLGLLNGRVVFVDYVL